MNRLQGLFFPDPDRDATAGDLITDAHGIKCPLDCGKGVSFAGRRGKIHRFICRDCGLEFTAVRERFKPRGGAA
jgi:hypothetical protein